LVALAAPDQADSTEKAQTKDRDSEKERQEHKQKESSTSAAITETAIMHDTVLPPLGVAKTSEHSAISEHHVRELDEILQRASTTPVARGLLYFKVALSAVVIVTSMILAFVLSGESEVVNNKVAEMLAVDAPLYLHEVSNNPASTAPTSSPNLSANSFADQNNTAAASLNESGVPVTASGVSDEGNNRTAGNITEEPFSAISATATNATTDNALLTSVNNPPTVTQELPASEPAAENATLVVALIQNAANVVSGTLSSTEEAGDSAEIPTAKTSIETSINDWLAAWQEGRFEDYLAAYHGEFIPSYHESYGLWLEQRRARIQGVTGISLAFDRLEYIDSSETEATIEFWLQYTRGSYADDTHKQLKFKKEGDRWLIVVERNIELIRLN